MPAAALPLFMLCVPELLPACTQKEMGRLRGEIAGKVQAQEEMLKRKTDDM